MNPEVQRQIVDSVADRLSPMGELSTLGLFVSIILSCLIIVIFVISVKSIGKSSKEGIGLLVDALTAASVSSREVASEMRVLRGDLSDGIERLTGEVVKLHICVDTLKALGERQNRRER